MTGSFWLVVAALAVVVGIIAVVKAKQLARPTAVGIDNYRNGRESERIATAQAARVVGVMLIALGLFIGVLDSTTVIASRGVGVQTQFNKVVGQPLGPGFHWVAPWRGVDEFDASVQTLKFYQAEKGDDGDCMNVRLANNTIACVDVTAQWNINHLGDVNALYLQYKTFDNIHNNLVIRQLQSSLNQVFGTFDPLAAPSSGSTAPAVTTKTLQDFVKADLQADLGSAITIDSVTVPLVHFDGATEDRLKQKQQAIADTTIANQRVQTAKAQAEANQILANNPSTTNPGVLYQNCLDEIEKLSQRNQLGNLPQTFNCNQGAQAGTLIQTGK